MPAISVLIKPASGRCNLKCEYCFYNDVTANRSEPDFGLMSYETLEALVSRVLDFADDFASFSFQGGEPTLRGLDFYKKLVELQAKYNAKGVRIENCLQTNGILMDEQWAQFLGQNRFLVGLSLDGPRNVHNAFRKNFNAEGTYAQVMQAARLMEAHHVDFNILFTVTSALAKEPGKVYGFFKKNHFRFLQFMPCIDPFAHERGRESFSLPPLEFAVFLMRFFDRWSQDLLAGNDVSVRYFDNLVRLAMGQQPEACSMRGACSCQFVFEADGSCYPCDFYVTERWRLGNINERGIIELFQAPACREFLSLGSQLSPDCRECRWLKVCRGGCRRDREDPASGAPGKNYFCRAYKAFLDYAWPTVMKLARYVAERNRQD